MSNQIGKDVQKFQLFLERLQIKIKKEIQINLVTIGVKKEKAYTSRNCILFHYAFHSTMDRNAKIHYIRN
jgi:hypothetical protein